MARDIENMTTKRTDTTASGITGHDAEDVREERWFEEAQAAFDRTVRILNLTCDNLEQGAAVTESEILKDLRSMNNALQHTMKMREVAREAGIERFGAKGAGTLDLDAARDEIRLRLACLRDRGSGAPVSGGAK